MKFGEIKIGEPFECWGDIHINYNYPKLCKCVKLSEDIAQEIDGISFYMDKNDEL